jgi:chromosome partitioning protein
MKVLAFANEKGGVAKTTLSTNVAAGLAAKGHRVLLIDTSAQGNATLMMGFPKYPGLYDMLVRDAQYLGDDGVMRVVPSEYYGGGGKSTLYLIGSNAETVSIASNTTDYWRLADRLDELRSNFDFVIVDTDPTPTMLHGAIYLAIEWIVYPTQCQALSVDGIAESVKHREAFTRKMKEVKMAGIVPTMFRDTLDEREQLKLLQANFPGRVREPIPFTVMWQEAASFCIPVFVHVPDHNAARRVRDLVEWVEAI